MQTALIFCGGGRANFLLRKTRPQCRSHAAEFLNVLKQFPGAGLPPVPPLEIPKYQDSAARIDNIQKRTFFLQK